MVKKAKPKKSVVVFCELRRPAEEIINISSQNGAEGVVTRMLPKSHVSHVILNANVSEERFLDMKVSTESKMQKKSMDVHDHFINTFVKRLERKQQRWIKEDEYVSKNLQVSTQARQKTAKEVIGSFSLPTPLPTPAAYKKAKYPYASVNRVPKSDTRQGRDTSLLPRIQTVPVGKPRPLPQPMKHVRLPEPQQSVVEDPTNWGAATNRVRMDSASTVATRFTGNGRRKAKPTRNYDSRFTELMTFLSPTNAMEGAFFRRPKVPRNVIMFGVSQTSF